MFDTPRSRAWSTQRELKQLKQKQHIDFSEEQVRPLKAIRLLIKSARAIKLYAAEGSERFGGER